MKHNIVEFLSDEAQFIKIDRSFQRKACWSIAQRRRFMKSSLKKRTPYPIVVADIKTGIKASVGDSNSTQKFKDLQDANYTMISLDGQNRLETYRAFYNSEFTISGEFKGADGVIYTVKNQAYKDLPPRLKDAFDMLSFDVSIMKHCIYSELHEIFVDINEGDSLNSQEKRNAIMSWISGYIREFSEIQKNSKLLMRIKGFDDQDVSRSLDAQWYAKLFASLCRPNRYNLTSTGLDGFYKQGESRNRSAITDYSEENVSRFEEIIRMVYSAVFSRSDTGTQVTQRQFWALVLAASNVYDSGERIYDYISFFDSVVAADRSLCSVSADDFANAQRQHTIDPEENSEPVRSHYYFFWASNMNKASDRMKAKEKLINFLEADSQYINCLKEPLVIVEVVAK